MLLNNNVIVNSKLFFNKKTVVPFFLKSEYFLITSFAKVKNFGKAFFNFKLLILL